MEHMVMKAWHAIVIGKLMKDVPGFEHVLQEGFRAYDEETLAFFAIELSDIDKIIGAIERDIKRLDSEYAEGRIGWGFSTSELPICSTFPKS